MAEKKLTFEQAMARLEEIVAQMEAGEQPLDQSLALYEEGAKLMKQCAAMLDKAGLDAIVEVDGGVNVNTGRQLAAAGADMLVAGSALYGAPDAAAFIRDVKG